jgi:hypothetical protein
LSEIGASCRRFVEKWHDPAAIAALLKEQYHASVERVRRSHA